MNKEEFLKMSDDVMQFLIRNGYKVESTDKNSSKLTAFRRNIYSLNYCLILDFRTGMKDS